MISASQASRRRTSGGRSRPSAVVTDTSGFEVVAQGLVVEGDQEPGGDGVGVGDPVGVQGVLGERRPGRPTAGRRGRGGRGARGAGSRRSRRSRARRWGGGSGSGQGEQGGFEEGAVLGRAAAADPDPTGAVRGDRQGPAQVGGAFLAFQGGLEAAVDGRRGRRPRPGAGRPWPARRRPGTGRGGASASPHAGGSTHRAGGPRPPTRSRRPGRATPSRPPAPPGSGPAARSGPWPGPTRCLPSPRRRPARWVTQSPVDP